MIIQAKALALLTRESLALLKRLDMLKPFVLQEIMLPAAAPALEAQGAIERYLTAERRKMRSIVREYLGWLAGPGARAAQPDEAQRRYALLKLQFNIVLSQFDMFSDIMTQRSENETGVWLSGLDTLAADALDLPGNYYQAPAVVCYLDRGHGAAIRRARTRLPGGGINPVAIIRVPRERMVSNSLASSLIHEVGHQGTALLGLISSLHPTLARRAREAGERQATWGLWDRWLSEILADFWSVSQVGVTASLGLMGVVSLPRAFVFRVNLDDPHPIPWIRLKISCAMGNALYPHPQWAELSAMWETLNPLDGLDERRKGLLCSLEEEMPAFLALVLNHRPPALRGSTLGKAFTIADRRPEALRAAFQRWRALPVDQKSRAAPTLAFAMIGQARQDGILSPDAESRLLSALLTRWAVRGALIPTAARALAARPPGDALAV